MNYINTVQSENKLILAFKDYELILAPQLDNCVKVTFRNINAREKKQADFVYPHVFKDFTFEETDDEVCVFLPKIDIKAAKSNAAVSFYDKKGRLIACENADEPKKLEAYQVMKIQSAENAKVHEEMTIDGMRSKVEAGDDEFDHTGYHCTLNLDSASKGLYGFGSHEDGFANLRGRYRYFYQHNFKALVPHMVSSEGFSVLMDTASAMHFNDDGATSTIVIDSDDALSYYFTYAGSLDGIVAVYRELTGAVPMLPKWAFGYAQSKEHYHTQKELMDVAEEYRRRHIPLDLMVQDWQTWSEGLWGEKVFDLSRYPDPEGMTEKLHEMNIRLMLSIWPNMSGDGTNKREMLEKGYMLANGSTYNPFIPEAREIYFRQANDGIFSKGIDAWWCDCSEPMEADWGIRGPRLSDEERFDINTKEIRKYLPAEEICMFPYWHAAAMYEGQRRTTDKKRVVNLTRASYAGQQRYSTILWSGDVAASWKELKTQVAEGPNFTVTGFPYWTNDAGAFFPGGPRKAKEGEEQRPTPWFMCGSFNDGVADLGYREFYTRWIQYAVFLPMFRSHGTATPREIWQFGESGTMFYDALEKAIRLRYSLIDYIYSLSARVTRDNYTMLRTLAFDFANDEKIYDIADEFMFGDFLVCPVTEPMYYLPESVPIENADRTRRVYLPGTEGWYDYRTGAYYKGGTEITACADIDSIPVFVREGSIIPVIADKIEYSEEKPASPRELRVYEGRSGKFEYYRDECDNYNYENGAFAVFTVEYLDECRKIIFSKCEGEFDGMEKTMDFMLVLNCKNGKKIEKLISYNGNACEITL